MSGIFWGSVQSSRIEAFVPGALNEQVIVGGVRAVYRLSDNSTLLVGPREHNGQSTPYISKVTPGGEVDTTFLSNIGTAADGIASTDDISVCVDSGGIYVVGKFTSWNGESAPNGVVKLSNSGNRVAGYGSGWANLVPASTVIFAACAVDDSGRLVLSRTNGGDSYLTRLNAGGTAIDGAQPTPGSSGAQRATLQRISGGFLVVNNASTDNVAYLTDSMTLTNYRATVNAVGRAILNYNKTKAYVVTSNTAASEFTLPTLPAPTARSPYISRPPPGNSPGGPTSDAKLVSKKDTGAPSNANKLFKMDESMTEEAYSTDTFVGAASVTTFPDENLGIIHSDIGFQVNGVGPSYFMRSFALDTLALLEVPPEPTYPFATSQWEAIGVSGPSDPMILGGVSNSTTTVTVDASFASLTTGGKVEWVVNGTKVREDTIAPGTTTYNQAEVVPAGTLTVLLWANSSLTVVEATATSTSPSWYNVSMRATTTILNGCRLRIFSPTSPSIANLRIYDVLYGENAYASPNTADYDTHVLDKGVLYDDIGSRTTTTDGTTIEIYGAWVGAGSRQTLLDAQL